MASIVCVPTSPVAVLDACRVSVDDAPDNTLTGYVGNGTQYPASPAVNYYLTFELASEIVGKSYVFGTNDDGTHVFNNYVFPVDGSWTIRLNDAADDSSVATASVTVTA
jgi:hypothetical protein